MVTGQMADEIRQAAIANFDQANDLEAWLEAKAIDPEDLFREMRLQVDAAKNRLERGHDWHSVLMGAIGFGFQMGYTVRERRSLE